MRTPPGTGDSFPYATIALLLACALATLAFHASGGSELFLCFPREPFALYGFPTLLSLFTHGDFSHLLVNGALLLLAGCALESRLGWKRVVGLFFAGGLAGILGQASVTATATIGASGALYALLVALMLTRPPEARVGPLELAVAALVCVDLFGLKSGSALIGHGAHLGGACAGLAFCISGLLRAAPGAGLRT